MAKGIQAWSRTSRLTLRTNVAMQLIVPFCQQENCNRFLHVALHKSVFHCKVPTDVAYRQMMSRLTKNIILGNLLRTFASARRFALPQSRTLCHATKHNRPTAYIQCEQTVVFASCQTVVSPILRSNLAKRCEQLRPEIPGRSDRWLVSERNQ